MDVIFCVKIHLRCHFTSRTYLGIIWPALSFNLNRIRLLLMTLWFTSRRKHNHTKRKVKYLQALHVNLVETSAFKPSINVFCKTEAVFFMESSRHPVASFFRHPVNHLKHFNVCTYVLRSLWRTLQILILMQSAILQRSVECYFLHYSSLASFLIWLSLINLPLYIIVGSLTNWFSSSSFISFIVVVVVVKNVC